MPEVLKKKVTQQQLADLLGESQQAVQQFFAKGILTRGDDLVQSLVKYARHMREVAAGRQPLNGSVDRMLEAALLDRTKREEIEIRIAEKRGALIPDDVFITGHAETFVAIKTRLLAMPTRLRARREHWTSDDVTAVEDEIRDTLTELSDDRFPRSIRDRLAAVRSSLPARPKTNRQPVGRRQKKTKQRK